MTVDDRSYLPISASLIMEGCHKLLIGKDVVGARDRDRTCDPYHVKATIRELIYGLTVANDN